MKNLEYYEVYENGPDGLEITMGAFSNKDDAIGFASNKGPYGFPAQIRLKHVALYESKEEAEKFLEGKRPIKKVVGFSNYYVS